MKHTLIAILMAGSALLMSAVQAQTPASGSTTTPAAKKAVKKPAKKPAAPTVEEDEKEPDVAGTTVSELQCELGVKLTIFQNNDDSDHAALKWGKRIHQMDRIHTTTGASRFENKRYGLVWIGLPGKGILLDSKTGHQLANECTTAEQRAEVLEAKAAEAAQPAQK